VWTSAIIAIFILYADNADWVRNGQRVFEKPKLELDKNALWQIYQHRKKILGGLHGLLHTAAMTFASGILYAALADKYNLSFWTWKFNSSFFVLTLIVGGAAGAVVFASYLYATCRWLGVSANDALSSQSLDSYRNFLRFRYKDGQLTVYPIGIDRVLSREQWSPRKDLSFASLVAPSAKIDCALIEPPIAIAIPRSRISTTRVLQNGRKATGKTGIRK
jgi:hypothetical protein